MEPKQLAQFCHTLRLRIRLGIAYACLVLALLVLGAFTAQHGWYRGFLAGLLSGIDIVVMICVVRWRAMLRGTPDAQRRLEEACRREYDEREQFLWQKSARTAVWGALGLLLPAGVAALYFSRAAGFALMAAACGPLVINKVLSAPTARRRPKRRKKRGCLRQAAPSFIHKHSTTPPGRPQQAAHAERCTQRANRRKRQKVLTGLCKPQARPAATVLPPKAQARHYAKAGMTKKYIST